MKLQKSMLDTRIERMRALLKDRPESIEQLNNWNILSKTQKKVLCYTSQVYIEPTDPLMQDDTKTPT